MLTEKLPNGGRYIQSFNIIKESLVTKYGEPVEDIISNFVDQSRVDNVGESSALEYGYVAYKTTWDTEETEILLGMLSTNYEVQITIAYTDKNTEKEVDTNGL
ncbi:hypothetical protein [Chakrabartyella piscis]|uniref:hypothetical protein n=1 Tax=Chakrabartyella piscis TaxID=2918914 RepID=UPI002958B5D6|nr:hypothetical protein [Chakrabartyella piscis]